METIILNDQAGLDNVKNWLQNMQQRGTPKHFEILVDGRRIVNKTDVHEEFDLCKKWIDDLTQSLRVMVYNTKNSHRAQIFELRTERYVEGKSNKLYATRQRILSEDEIERRVQIKFEEQKRDTKLSELSAENRVMKKRLADAEEFINKLEQEKLNNEKEKDDFDLTGIIKSFFPNQKDQVEHSGNIDAEKSSSFDNVETGTENTATFKKKGPVTEQDQSEINTLNETEKSDLELLRKAFKSMGAERYDKTKEMLKFLCDQPTFVDINHESLMNVAGQLGWKG